MSGKYYNELIGPEFQKKKSRDAARSRRGQQNDEFLELAGQLPVPPLEAGQLDRLSIMRLTNSYVKIKHVLNYLMAKDFETPLVKMETCSDSIEQLISEALDGFVFVIGSDGRCLYVSDSISRYLGLMPIEMTGNSFYKYIHPCDHEEVAKELCGKIPLEDMEIFDGLFCSDSVFMMSNNLKGGSKDKMSDIERQPYRSFFVRIKSTLTSRGKSVNLKASTYRVVHCTGCLKMLKNDAENNGRSSPLCFIGIGVPLMYTSTFEVPLDQATFSSHHDLDLTFVYSENGIEEILGYLPSEVLGKSLFKLLHGCDQDVLANCHKTLLTKGQCVSGYYRLLAKYGGWVWFQTKASIVYASKTCQPQFVLCVHYAISGIEDEDDMLSLDQVQRVRERQQSPSNSPADHTKYSSIANNKRIPVIRKCPEKSSLPFQSAGNTNTKSTENRNLNLELSIDMDLTGVCFDEEMPEISEVEASESEEYFSSLDTQTIKDTEKYHEFMNSPSIPSPTYDTTILPGNLLEANIDYCAPFIPPPLGDTQFSVDEKELEMFNMNTTFGCDDSEWKNEMWEISSDLDKEIQKGLIKRNLSTPTFFPLAEKIYPEP